LLITSTNRASRELGDLDHPAQNEKMSGGKMQLGNETKYVQMFLNYHRSCNMVTQITFFASAALDIVFLSCDDKPSIERFGP